MKKYFIFFLIAVAGFSCKKKTDDNCGNTDLDCSAVQCLLMNYNFSFRIVDKATGADLVFGSSPRYTTGDIRLFYDAAATRPITLMADQATKQFNTLFSKEEMYLTVAGSAPYKLAATFRSISCCSNQVRTLKIDDRSLCTCCGDVIDLPVN